MSEKVSVIIAVYNKAPYLGAMLKSVSKQVYRNLEIVIVNDGSTDNSVEVIRAWERIFSADGFGVTIIEQENSGVAAALKTGLENATGEYVCFPDADDELLPEYVSLMVETISRGYDYTFCGFMSRSAENGAIVPFYNKVDTSISIGDNILERYLLKKSPKA